MNTRHFLKAVAAAAVVAMSGGALAQAYPDRPIKLIVPFAPGGSTDLAARLVAEFAGRELGQSIVVENKAGAGGSLGMEFVAKSKPDGYTLGMATVSTHGSNPAVYGNKLKYDAIKDFAPISLMATAPFVMVVHPSVKATDIASFVALAKAQPGTLSFGSAGVGSGPHLDGEQLRQQAGVDVLHVPYRGGGTVITDLLGGQVQFGFATVPTMLEHIKGGKLRALAVTSPQRVSQLPDVPTFAEAGLPGVDISPLFGLVAPAGVPAPIIERLSQTLAESVQRGALRDKLTGMGFQPVGSTPAQFAQRIQEDVAKWTGVIQRGNIKAE